MQSAPVGWPVGNDELTPTATVIHTVNGDQATVTPASWTIRRELATDLPDQIQAAQGSSVASATIVLPQEAPETVANAWSPWHGRVVVRRPAGAAVQLSAGFSGSEIPLFVGRVAEPSGDITSPAINLDCDDLASLLRNPTTLPAVAREMPHDIGDSVSILYTGLTATWAVDAILREGGFNATPATVAGAAVVATMQGSVWPELGRLTRANQGDTTQPRFAGIRWSGRRMLGWQAPLSGTFNLRIEPAQVVGLASMHLSGWADGSSGTATVDLRAGGSADSRVTVTITATQITVRFRADSGAVDTSQSYAFSGGPFDVDVQRLTATTVRVIVVRSTGTSQNDLVTGVFGGNLDNVEGSLSAGNLVLAGLQVSPHITGTIAVSHVPTADLDPSLNDIDGTPGIEGDQTQWATLREIAAAELAVVYIAEDGTAVFRNRDSLRGLNIVPGGLLLPGAPGSYASTPDTAALDIVGNLFLYADITPDDWTPAADQALIAKWFDSTNNRSFRLLLLTTGRLQLNWSSNGTNVLTAPGAIPPTPPPSGRLAVGVDIDVDNGAGGRTITIYTAPTAAGPWVQLEQIVQATGTTSIFSGNAALEVGARAGGTLTPFAGTIHAAGVRSGGIGGTTVAAPDFTAQSRGTTSFVDGVGLPWTLHGNAQITTTLPLLVTARDSILGLQWWSSVEQVRSAVHVPVMPVNVETSTDYSRTVWSLNEKVKLFEHGRRPWTIFAELDAVPIELDTTMRSQESGLTGSQYAAHPGADGSGSLRTLAVTVTQLTPRQVQIVARSDYGHPNPTWIVNNAGNPRMVLRALASIEQSDSAEGAAVAVNEGVEDTYGTSVLDMPASRWMQDMDSAQALAWWLAEQTRQPQPVIRNVPVVPGPDTLRLQLGDVIELVDPVVMGATVRCVVTGIYPSGSPGRLELSLRVRPVPYLFNDFDQEWPVETFADFDAAYAGVTFAEYDDNPWRSQ